ncbi:expressed unknown protein [Seminavis robusta]|uniref:Sulfotransferase domain-containing protein n=1 Tax=Seminavis robusta TaxID=568900 RepID=A0A9N8D6Z7_9STRA|nr:expressed unknown protein [Seminavis robusta]|eukprot:Sro3_g002720.1 n/a (477) ;mRNA; f:223841-225271
MTQLRTSSHLIFLGILGVLIVLMGLCHKTGVINVSQINASTAKHKTIGNTAGNTARKASSSQDYKNTKKYKELVATRGGGDPNRIYCDQNSKHPDCCSPDHCVVVQRSTLYSECCQNVPSSHHRHRQLPVHVAGQPRQPQQRPTPQRPITEPTLFPILITATPRSGTVFVQRLLKKLGLSVSDDFSIPHGDGMVSWMHVVQDDHYFGPVSNFKKSKFQTVWHQVRDPLKSLTSMAFTEPLREDGKQAGSVLYMRFLRRHIPVARKEEVLSKLKQQQTAITTTTTTTTTNNNQTTSPYNEQFLIHRGMEFYIHWHRYILSLRIPLFHLEDLTEHKNMTVLDAIFASVGKPLPDHTVATRLIDQKRRRQLQQQYTQPQTPTQSYTYPALNKPLAPATGKPPQRIPGNLLVSQYTSSSSSSSAAANNNKNKMKKGNTNSRKHRDTLSWEELCRVDAQLTKDFLKVCHEVGYYLDKEMVC